MKINNIGHQPSFKRAFTTKEREDYTRLISDAKKELGIKDTSVIVFDFNVPSQKNYNTGIGTTFSKNFKRFSKFLRKTIGIDSIQMQPQGKITKTNASPYSGTTFAIGEHIIDLKLLTTKKYGELLSPEDITSRKNTDVNAEYKTNYDLVLKSTQETLLKKAYNTFLDSDNTKLKNEFEKFRSTNNDWLEKESLFTALSEHYKTPDINEWNQLDKNLFSEKVSTDERNSRINEIKTQYKELIDYEEFKQFIADKQQENNHKYLDSNDIKLYGDCLIGFSRSEMWANQDCFLDGLYYGGPDPNCTETNFIQTWGLPAIDYTKIGECKSPDDISKLDKSGKLLFNKYKTFFKRYDGVRVDAAWQLITPFVYKQENNTYQQIDLPELDTTIFNIIKAAQKEVTQENNENIMLELVGISAGNSQEMTRNDYPHLYTTAYAQYDETPTKFKEKGYQDDMFYTGVGNHDNESLINQARDIETRKLHTKGIVRDFQPKLTQLGYETSDYINQDRETKVQENFRNLKMAEIFTSAKQFFTLPDMFGMEERINISGKKDDTNWSIRIPTDYENFYFSQLSKGYGINLPKVLATAMDLKKSENKQLIEKCNEAAEILRTSGPTTEKKANAADKKGLLTNKFEYKI